MKTAMYFVGLMAQARILGRCVPVYILWTSIALERPPNSAVFVGGPGGLPLRIFFNTH